MTTHPKAIPSTPSVLLVDDHPANLVALTAVLKQLHVRMVEACSGAEAIARIEGESFAVVLLDVQMPDMDGFETARRIRTTENGRDVPILFLTAIHRDEAYVRRGYAQGGADYITKPFDVEVLRARVRAFTSLYQQREESHRLRAETQAKRLDEAQRRLDAFERISTAALVTDDLSAFLHTLLTVFIGAADAADTVTILLAYGSELRTKASIGLHEEVVGGFTVSIGEGFSGVIALTGRPVLLQGEDIARHAQSEVLAARGLRVLFGVPLVAAGEVLGVAHIGSSKASAFSESERRLFSAMVERAAWVVSRQRARERIYSILHTAPALISTWRVPDYRCEFANEAFRSLHGGRDVIGAGITDLGATPDVVAAFERAGRGETSQFDEHALHVDFRGDGQPEERHFNFSLHPVRGMTGDVDAVLWFAVEVTSHVHAGRQLQASEADRERLLELERAARREAEIANRAKDEFLATVSHELRTPLNAILGWSSSARRGAPPDVDRALSIIERNARAQAKIIEDVLDLSRIIGGRLRLEITPTDVANVLSGAVEAIRPAADAKHITLEVCVDDDLGTIPADADRMQQVVWNLLSNAVKFTPKHGRVELRASRSPSEIRITVTDTGQGISPDFLNAAFEPFRQADGSPMRRHGGLGLGLAIVRQLVHAHGGETRAESPGEGRGATFTVTLPTRVVAAIDSGPVSVRTPVDPELQRLDGVRVLVVDDEEDVRLLMCELLGRQGAVVEVAASADEAMAMVRSFRPHVLVSDIGMPHRDGYSLIRDVRALPRSLGGTTPAVALTAYARAEDSHRAATAGFHAHVAKPAEPALLVRVIARLRGDAAAHDPVASPTGS